MPEQNEKQNESSEQIADLMSAAQLEKIKLEIEGLKSKNKWEDRVARYIPLITILLGLGGLFLGMIQFQGQQQLQQDRFISEQQKDRILRIQNQIRLDTEQLLQFTNDDKLSVSKISFLLEDLKTLLKSNGEEDQMSEFILKSKETITNSLVEMIRYDCDFINKPRDVYFATTVINYWDDYTNRLRKNVSDFDYILYKYVRTLQDLHRKNPKYFQGIEYDKLSDRYLVKSENLSEDNQFQHYGNVVLGFRRHLSIAGGNSDLVEKYVKDAESALHNPTLAKQLFTEFQFDSTASVANSSATPIPIFIFSPGRTRSGATGNIITLSASSSTFALSISLIDLDDFRDDSSKGFSMTIFAPSGNKIWSASSLKPDNLKSITVAMQSRLFQEGDYVLTLEALRPDGKVYTLSHYYFRVVRK